jgi:hypothetical protein
VQKDQPRARAQPNPFEPNAPEDLGERKQKTKLDTAKRATVSYNYSEQTSDNSTVSQSVSGSGWTRLGSASDSYSDTDSGIITISDTVTSSLDSFSVADNHSVGGSISATYSNSLGSATWTDNGVDTDELTASGTKSTTGDVYTFTNTESTRDNFFLNKTILGSMNGTASVSTDEGSTLSGGTSTGPSGSAFDYTDVTSSVCEINEGGTVTETGGPVPFSLTTSINVVLQLNVTGPTAATSTLTLANNVSSSGSNEGADLTETVYAGEGPTAGVSVAAQIGSSAPNNAEHLGTSPDSLDTSSGLMSALGGTGVHGMSFAGPDILPAASPGGQSLWLEESNQSSQTPTNWVSHPSGIGYRRNSPGITTVTGSGSSQTSSTGPPIPGNLPTMDSGTSDGGTDQELARLANFMTGGNENPTSTQPAATPRSVQAAIPLLPTGSPAATAISNPEGRDVIGDVMNDQGTGKWTPYGNPLYQPPGEASSNRGAQVSRYSMGRRGYGYGGGTSEPAEPAPGPPPQDPSPTDDGGKIIGADDDPNGGKSWDEPEDNKTDSGVGAYLWSSAAQVVKGNYTADQDRTWLGTGGEIGVGFVPVVSTVASARDLSYDVTHWQWSWGHALQTTGDVLGLVPFVRGAVKSVKAVSRGVGGAGKVATVASAGLGAGAASAFTKNADDLADGLKKVIASKTFSSFDALKRELGSAGEGNVWHHVVEQRAANVANFGAEAIHSTENVVSVSRGVNQAIANYYSSIRPFSNGMAVRQWLNSQSFAEQSAFGRRVLDLVLSGGTLP